MERPCPPKRCRLLLVPCPYQGHINPMLQLATFLHQNGFSITIAHTFFNSLHPHRHPEFTFIRLNDNLPLDDVSSWDLGSVLLAVNNNCRASLEEAVAAMAGETGEGSGEVMCIIHDELMYFCEAVASRFGVRSLVFRTTSAAACVSRCAILRLSAEGRLPVQKDDGIPKHEAIPADLIAVLLDLNVNCRASFEDQMRRLIGGGGGGGGAGEEVVAGVIYDEVMFFCEEVLSDLKVRSFILRTTCAAASLARMALVRLNDEGYFPLKECMLQDPAPELHPLRFKDLPISLTTGFTKYPTLVKGMYNLETPIKAEAIIWNTMEWLEESTVSQIKTKSTTVPVFFIGPLHRIVSARTSVLNEDFNCLQWLDEQADGSVVYVAIGSIASLGEKELGEMAWGLANSQQPFLWVVQPGAVRGSEWIEALPDGFPEAVGGRGCVVKWAPQKEVLAHRAVGGFWSHCGWNSSMESLSEGVPMLCSPCFGDQKVNARYLSHVWRVGLQLENGLERGEIENGIKRLMDEEQGREIRDRAKHFKEKIEAHVKVEEDQCSSRTHLKDLVSLLSSF